MGNPFDIYKDKQASGSSYGNYEATYERYAKMHAEYDELLFNFNETATSAKAQAEADVAAAQKQIDKANKHAATMAAISGTAQLLSTGASIFSSIKAMKNVPSTTPATTAVQASVSSKSDDPTTEAGYQEKINAAHAEYEKYAAEVTRLESEQSNLLGQGGTLAKLQKDIDNQNDFISELEAAKNFKEGEKAAKIVAQDKIIEKADADIEVVDKTELPTANADLESGKEELETANKMETTKTTTDPTTGQQKTEEDPSLVQKKKAAINAANAKIKKAKDDIDAANKKREKAVDAKAQAERLKTALENDLDAEITKARAELRDLVTKNAKAQSNDRDLTSARSNRDSAKNTETSWRCKLDLFKKKQTTQAS